MGKTCKPNRLMVRFDDRDYIRIVELSKLCGTPLSVTIRALITKSLDDITDQAGFLIFKRK